MRIYIFGVQKKYHKRSFIFFEKLFGVNITQNHSINWNWYLDVINSGEILTVNSMWQNKFFELWKKVGVALVRKLWESRIKKKWNNPKNRKLLNLRVPNFLYSNSCHFFTLLSSLLLSFLFSCGPLISHWAARLPGQIFF